MNQAKANSAARVSLPCPAHDTRVLQIVANEGRGADSPAANPATVSRIDSVVSRNCDGQSLPDAEAPAATGQRAQAARLGANIRGDGMGRLAEPAAHLSTVARNLRW